jgi:hypothetical protein
MKALPVEKLPEGDWLYEIKFDGYRALAFKNGKEVCLVSRDKKAFDYPQLVDSLKSIPADRVILDGEIAALDEKGRSSFQLLQLFKSSGGVPLVYYVFDLLFLEGKDLRAEPLNGQEAVLHRNGKGCWSFYYYPDRAEDYCTETHPGDMVGAHAVFVATLGHALVESRGIEEGILQVLTYACNWHEEGFGTNADTPIYPLSKIADWTEAGATRSIQSTAIDPTQVSRPLFLLHDGAGKEIDPKKISRDVLVHGLQTIERLPRAEFKIKKPMRADELIVWLDPREIETYRHVAGLIGEYVRRKTTRPLSIAVFGPAGSGKSFGISTVAETVGLPQKLEFNLSQWDSTEYLVTSFHKVREVSVRGEIPLVFFDEFDSSRDSQPLAWLKYFLAPMQDGKFRDGDSEYSLGKSVFVFAGSTSDTFQEFQEKSKDITKAKVPDFLSRLRGHVDVLGPSRKNKEDELYILRRALVLRSLLQKRAPGIFVGEDVLDRLLNWEYQHGSRSMEAVLDMSRIAGKPSFGLADLPPDEQLALHIK